MRYAVAQGRTAYGSRKAYESCRPYGHRSIAAGLVIRRGTVRRTDIRYGVQKIATAYEGVSAVRTVVRRGRNARRTEACRGWAQPRQEFFRRCRSTNRMIAMKTA